MRRLTFPLIAVLSVLTPSSVVVAQSPPLTPFRGLIDHISADQWGGASAGAEVWHRAISGDGRFVVINSPSSNLSADDNEDYNGYDDVFLRDRMTGTITRISRSFDGGSGDGLSQMGTISTNGRHVAFASGSSNLVPGDTNDHWDVFVRDLDQQRTVRVSVATDGTQGDRDAYYPSLSADGRFVAFVSWATTFAPGVSPYAPRQMYLHDRDADGNGVFDETGGVTTELISAGLTGEIADQSVDGPRVTSDGRYVLFETSATNLESSGNLNGSNHLYRRDRQTGQTELIDRAVTGGPSAWGVGYRTSDMSDDGRFITFSSISPDIVWFDMNWQSQVFLYDTVAGPLATTIVSQLPDGTIGDGSSYASSVSADGRYVMFTTAASNLAWPPPAPAMLAVRDMLDGSFARVDVLDSGQEFDQSDYYYTPAISADGTAIVLQSRSNYALGGGYGYGASHAFVLTAFSASPESASYPGSGGSGSIEVNTTAVSGWRVFSSFPWIAVTAGDGFGAGPRTVQYDVLPNSDGAARDGWMLLGSKYIYIHQDSADMTPPVITPIVNGTLGDNGWYTSDVSVSFVYEDLESPITSAVGCDPTTQTTDTAGTTFSCTVTSEGGSSTVQAIVTRDATPPGGIIWGPPYAEFLHQKNSVYVTDYGCGDTMSGIASCIGPVPDGGYLPTSVAGRFTFDVQARDRAGNTGIISRPYYVSTNVCSPRPPGLVGWWPGDGHSRDIIARNDGSVVNGTPIYTSGPYGMGFVFIQSRYMWVPDVAALRMDDAFTLSAWVYQTRWLTPYAVIAGREGEYLLARGPNGNIHYSIGNTDPGWGWVDTGVRMDHERWIKFALTYDGSAIRLYKNGQLAYERTASGVIGDAAPFQNAFQVAARQSASEPSYFDGTIDDVELVDRAMSDAEIDTAYMSGIGGICPLTTTLSFTPTPQSATYGGSAELVARVTDDQAQPIQGEQVQFTFRNVSAGTATTDATGVARVPVSITGLAAQTLVNAAQATHPATAYLKYSSANSDFVIDRASPVITWNAPAAIDYGTGLGGAQLNATANVAGTFVYSLAAGTILPAGAHTLNVTFTPSSANYSVATSSVPLTVLKATPTVTATGGTFTYDAQPHAGSGGATGAQGETLTPVTITYNGSSSTAPTNAGNHTVRASFAGSANYNAAQSADVPLIINRRTPTVDFDTTTAWYGGVPRTAIVFVRGLGGVELNPYTVRYDGSTTGPVNAGTYALEVQFDGNTNYAPITANSSFVIRKNFPIFPTLNDTGVTYDGQPHGGYNVTVIGVQNEHLTPVIYTYNGSTTVPINAGVYTAVVRYDGSANYEADSRTFTLTIFKAQPYLQWGIPASIIYETPLGDGQLNATVDVPGTFEYSPPAGTVLNVGTHTLAATFTPADTQNYETRTISRSVSVTKRTIYFTWSRPADVVYGMPLSSTQLNATARVPGTFTYSPPAGTILSAGDHVLQVTFTPDDTSNYDGSSGGVGFTVTKVTPVLSWSSPPDIVYGTALSANELNATVNAPGTLAYSPATGVVLGAGPQTLSVTFTPDDIANYNGATASVTVNVTKAPSTLTWPIPGDIVYGTALGASQLNATANVPGTFNYSPGTGAILDAGPQTLTVTFTPTDAANYAGANASVLLNVTKSVPTITWLTPGDIVYGTALGASQLNATSNVAGTLVYLPAAGAILNAGTQTLEVTFTPDDAANYTGATVDVTLNVTKAASTITWLSPADIVYGTALDASQLNATANVAGTLAYSPASGTVLTAGSHALSVTFTPTDSINYNDATALVTVNVTKATPVVTWPNPAAIVYGTALSATQLNASATVAGSFTYSPAAGTVLNAGTQQLSVTFTPADAANYTSATASAAISIAPAALTLQTNNATKVYGAALPAFTASGAGFVNGDSMSSLGGTLTFTTSATATSAPGSYSVTPSGASSANYSITFADGTLTVTTAATSMTFTTSPNPSNNNQTVQLRAVVSAVAPGAGTATGTVEFRDNGTLLGTATLVNGVATMNKNFKRGTHPLTATYAGSTNFTGSSGAVTHSTQ